MKIGLFCAALNEQGGVTGINTYSVALVESLYEYDLNNEYVLFLSKTNKKHFENIKENDRWEIVLIEPKLIENNSKIKKIYRILNILKPFNKDKKFNYESTGFVNLPFDKLNNLDLVHFTVFNSCSSIPYFINIPYVVTMHDLRLFRKEFQKSIFDKGYLTFVVMKIIIKRVLEKSKAILSETNEVKSDILEYIGSFSSKANVAISPLPNKFYNQKEGSSFSIVQKKYQISEKFLFYPSVLSEDKNHLRLIKAVKLLKDSIPDLQVILTGPDGGTLDKIEKYIMENKLENNIKYLGFVSLEELQTLYKQCHGLVMPSLFESVSLPVFEAMMYGKAVATSNICGMPDQLGELGIYFDPRDINSIVDATKKLWEQNNIDGNQFIERAKKMLDKKIYSEKLVKIYKEVNNDK